MGTEKQQDVDQKIDFMHFIERVAAKTQAIKNRARKLANIGRAIQLAHRNGDFAIIHPCIDGKNGWQISRFDHFGPYSDSRRATYFDVAVLAVEEGFRKIVEIDGGI